MERITSPRQFPRARGEFYINKIAADAPHLARVRDISAGGMYLYKLLEPRHAGQSEFTVEMQLPGSTDLIWAACEVVREDDGAPADIEGYAVRFSRLAEADRRRIEEFVRAKAH